MSERAETTTAGNKGGAAKLLAEALVCERDGRVGEAGELYEGAVVAAERDSDLSVLSEALRRFAVVRYHANDADGARELCRRSVVAATALGDDVLAAHALNTQATVDLQTGELEAAEAGYRRALELGGEDRALRARLEQNLGILANIHGDLDEAQTRYQAALAAYESTDDVDGSAMTYHNLGMVSAARGEWDEAEEYYEQSRTIAEALGETHLMGLCLGNQGEVFLKRQQYDRARECAEEALTIFDRLAAWPAKASAYRVIGMVYRDTGRLALAESRFASAMELAVKAGSLLGQAEVARERALLYQTMGRNQEALSLLNSAHRLFDRLDARVELINVTRHAEDLENTYLAVVREWGGSIESSDAYTHGHCERVATYAVALARALNMDDDEVKTIQIGAYLHDVGKVRVPHEILNKPGKLTEEEFDIMKRHTIWGVEMLEDVDFPWDIRPIIRWHHEKYDGTGYPDRRRGDEIPLAAQVIGIVDVYDALTTTRSYRKAMSHEKAIGIIEESRHHWRSDVVDAFFASIAVEYERTLAAA